MGGLYAKEKETWLGTEIENYFKRYNDVKPDEIEDYLGTMIDNEFDTYFEDNSLKEVSKNFCIAYPLSLTDPNAELFQEMRNKMEASSSKPHPTTADHKQNEVEVPCEEMEQLDVSEKTTEDDGWTTVTKKNKKLK